MGTSLDEDAASSKGDMGGFLGCSACAEHQLTHRMEWHWQAEDVSVKRSR